MFQHNIAYMFNSFTSLLNIDIDILPVIIKSLHEEILKAID